MNEQQPIGLGMVGIGRAGWGMHTEELKGREDKFRIVAACDILAERRELMRERYGCAVYERIEDLVADPAVEVVDIATRSVDHYAHALTALMAGKHVFQEKPFAETADQARHLVEFCEQPGAPKIYARHNRRFEALFNQILQWQENKLLGDIYEVHITRNGYNRRDDWQTLKSYGGGQLLNWGPHIIDQSLCILGGGYESLYSDRKHLVAAGDCEDHGTIFFRNREGLVVTMQISGGVALTTPEYRVYGTRGAAEMSGKRMHLRYIDPAQQLPPPKANEETPGRSFGKSGTFESSESIRWIERILERGHEDLSVIWDYLYDSVRNGAPFPITPQEAVAVIAVIDTVREQNNDLKSYSPAGPV